MYTQETLDKIAVWRQRCNDGTITPEEMREALAALRQDRLLAAQTSAKSKSGGGKSKAPTKSSDDLLAELEGM